ncbi:RING finger protein 145-like isoform 1-T1 [Liasis olivaceus]
MAAEPSRGGMPRGEEVGPGAKPREGARRPGVRAMPPRLERVANVVLRVPPVVLLDRLYRWDVQAFADTGRPLADLPHLRGRRLWSLYYAGHLLCAAVVLLPLRSLVNLHLRLLAALLLCLAHRLAWDYIHQEMERGFQGTIYEDSVALGHFATALTGGNHRPLRSAAEARAGDSALRPPPPAGCPAVLPPCPSPAFRRHLRCGPHSPGAAVWGGGLAGGAFPRGGGSLPRDLAAVPGAHGGPRPPPSILELLFGGNAGRTGLCARGTIQDPEVYHPVTLGVSLWRRLAVPLLFSTYWLILFSLQIFASASSSSGPLLSQRGWTFIFLSSVAECCSTPYSLIGLTFTVSYLALGLLQLGKLYLAGYGTFQNGNVMHRGVTEGATLLLLALQTGLLDLQLLQRTFLLSIIFFIMVTSTLQSMFEIAEPVVLGLGASQNRSFWKHFRAVSMCLFLLAAPGFMACKIAHFFHLDFWLLILISSCMLTSLQVTGTLFIYSLFMIELFQDRPVEKMDEIIYWVNAISRVLEFLVAVCVVAYGTWESLLGEWTWMGASVIIIHCYFNVWLRAQSGWKSFLLRQEAAKKISFLPRATSRQLEEHDDLCAICFQEMALAVIMQCGHFFHEGCLRKWFYVQDTCPLCHQAVQVPAGQEGRRGGAAPEETPLPQHGESTGHRSTADSGGDGTGKSGTSSWTEQPSPLPAGSTGEELCRGLRGGVPGLSPSPERATAAAESDEVPVLESLLKLGESGEALSVGQSPLSHGPLQGELRLSSTPRDTGPPWPSAPLGALANRHGESPTPTANCSTAVGRDAETVGGVQGKPDTTRGRSDSPVPLPKPQPSLSGFSP